jgi:hypothetical protein
MVKHMAFDGLAQLARLPPWTSVYAGAWTVKPTGIEAYIKQQSYRARGAHQFGSQVGICSLARP